MSQSNKVDKSILKVDWCSHEAAKYACEHWYYTHSIPASRIVKIGAWERGQFVGVVIFSHGINHNVGRPYDCTEQECCELSRVAFRSHETSLTRILSIAIHKFLKKQSPGLRLILSFADSTIHHGGIYQGMNWYYLGDSPPADRYLYNGQEMHGRSVRSTWGRNALGRIKGLTRIEDTAKHRYGYPLDEEMRKQLQSLAKPFPKKKNCLESVVGDTLTSQRESESFESAVKAPLCVTGANGNTTAYQAVDNGSIPIVTLHSSVQDEVMYEQHSII